MTKQELLSSPAFQKAKGEALIYFSPAPCLNELYYTWITAPRWDDQIKDHLRFSRYEIPVSKAELLSDKVFMKSRKDKILTFDYSSFWYASGPCTVRLAANGDIELKEKF